MVEPHVRDHRHAAVPRVRRVQAAAEADLDQGDVEPGLREVAEHHRRQQLELRRRAVAPLDRVGHGEHLADQPGERRGLDRPPVDDDPLAVRDQVRLGGLADAVAGRAQRGSRERDDAALPVGAGDERAPDGQLRVAHRAQQGPHASEPEPDPEAAARLDRGERLGVREVGRSRRDLALAADGHDFVSSSS